jgi:hypothetical protein
MIIRGGGGASFLEENGIINTNIHNRHRWIDGVTICFCYLKNEKLKIKK